ncbi:MAG: hypothetical protein AAGB01_00780, partial [Cyanobacteria bacterium P01_F01_bin.42]
CEEIDMMDNWQFFLQKEGDYAWLPLETPQVEILEGRYQLIAHTSESSSTVRVTIQHQHDLDSVAQDNRQEEFRSVESSGKVEILPLAYLGLGSWSIACYPQPPEEMGATATLSQAPYALEIQVLPQDFDLFEDWDYENSDRATAQIADAACEDMSNSPNKAIDEEPLGLEHSTPRIDIPAGRVFLPSFSDSAPVIEFRTVEPHGLPRLISDDTVLESPLSPELPPFSRSQLALRDKLARRQRALTKIQCIGAAISQHSLELSLPVFEEKFKSKLSQMALPGS